jgi:D-alanyl-D-alanine carboxypeptidase
MTTSRRSLIAAGAALATLPGEAFAAWPFQAKAPVGCRGRAAYAGGALHPGLEAAVFDAAAQVGGARVTPFVSDDLDTRLEKIAAGMKSLTLTAAVARSDGTLWNQALAASGEPPAPASFQWPGLADVLVATAVLQLVEEGKLTLATTIERWAPDIATARWITIEDLLGHTSGLSAAPAAGGAFASPYCPGAGWSGVEADYQLLARIVEALDGKPWPQAVSARTIEARELKEMTLSAQGMVTASAADVVKFWRALLANGLHSPEMTRHRFVRLYPMTATPTRTWWGLGVMASDLAADKFNGADTWLGQSRTAPGVAATIAYSPRRKAFAALALTGPGSADAALDLLHLGVQAEPVALRFTPRPPQPAKRARRRPSPKSR